MECISSLLLLFCILPVVSMSTYPISIFLFCSCSTLVLLLLVIVASSFCGKKLLAMETTSNLVFHHCVVAPSFCGKKSFLQWRVVCDLVFHHCVVAFSSVRKKLLAMEITLVVILQLWWWSLLCSNTKWLPQAKHAIQTLHPKSLSNPGVSHCFVYMPLSLSFGHNFWAHGPLYTRCNAHSEHSSVSIAIRSYCCCCCWGCPTICYLRLVAANFQYQGREKKHIQIL